MKVVYGNYENSRLKPGDRIFFLIASGYVRSPYGAIVFRARGCPFVIRSSSYVTRGALRLPR